MRLTSLNIFSIKTSNAMEYIKLNIQKYQEPMVLSSIMYEKTYLLMYIMWPISQSHFHVSFYVHCNEVHEHVQ